MLFVLRLADRVRISGLSSTTLYRSSNTCAIDIVDGETDSMTGSDSILRNIVQREATAAVVNH